MRHILEKVEGSCGKSSLYHIMLARDLGMIKIRDVVESSKYKELVSISAEAIVDRFKIVMVSNQTNTGAAGRAGGVGRASIAGNVSSVGTVAQSPSIALR